MNIQEFRKENPSYNNIPDAELTDRLWKKYYSSMDRKEFEKKFLGEQVKPASVTPESVLKEDLKKNPMNMPERFLTGVGHGMYRTVKGAEQALSEIGIGRDTKTITAEGEEEARMFKPLEESSTAAKIGTVAGETAPYMVLPGGVTGGLLRRTAVSAGMGAAQGALSLKKEDESRMRNATVGAGLGAGGSVLTSGAGKVVNAVMGKYVKSEAEKLGKKFNIPTSLAEDIDAPRLKVVETLAEKVPWLGIGGFRKKQLAAAETAARNTLDRYVANPKQPDFWGNKDFVDALYQDVRATAEKINVTSRAENTYVASKELLERYPSIFDSIQDQKTKKIVKNIIGDTSNFKQPPGEVGNITFDDLWSLRKGLGTAKETARGSGNMEAVGVISDIKKAVDKDINAISNTSNLGITQKLSVANESYQKYHVKYELMQEAFDKAIGKKGALEFFSPKKFSTELKNMVYDANIKQKSRLFTPEEVEHFTGLANIMQVVKRAGQYQENVATGNRGVDFLMTGGLGLDIGYALHNPAGAALSAGSVVGFTSIVKFLTTTTAGKNLIKAGSKVEPDSPTMKKIIDKIYQAVPRAAAAPDAAQLAIGSQNEH